jgi:mono/diheme cytochrome c family protein
MKRRSQIATFVTGACLTAAAATTARWDKVPPKDHARTNPMAGKAQAVAGGAALYKEHCAQCHGANGLGDGAKKPALHSDVIRSASDGDLEWFLRQGDIGHGMPSWSNLPQAQRWQIICYLRSLNAQP